MSAKRILTFLLAIAFSSPLAARAQSGGGAAPENKNYKSMAVRTDEQIPTPSANFVNWFFNGSNIRIKLHDGTFSDLGGGGGGYPSLTEDPTGTLTLYDPTAATGFTQFALKAGAGQVAGDALMRFKAFDNTTLGEFQTLGATARMLMAGNNDSFAHFGVMTDTALTDFNWYVDGAGNTVIANTNALIRWGGDLDLHRSGVNTLTVGNGSTGLGSLNALAVTVSNVGYGALLFENGLSLGQFNAVSWTNANGGDAPHDISLVRDDAGILAQKDGTNAQEFRVYQSTTGPVYGYFQSNVGATGQPGVGSNTAGFAVTAGGGVLHLGSTGSDVSIEAAGVGVNWVFKNAGNLLPNTDNAYTIGDDSHRVSTVFTAAVNGPNLGIRSQGLSDVYFGANGGSAWHIAAATQAFGPFADDTFDFGDTTNGVANIYAHHYWLYDGTDYVEVTIGAADSGGAGRRALTVAN